MNRINNVDDKSIKAETAVVIFLLLNFLVIDVTFLAEYSYYPGAIFLSKIFKGVMVIIMLLYTLHIGKLKMFKVSYSFIVFSILSMVTGYIRAGNGYTMMSHLYSYIMPIIVASSSYYFMDIYINNKSIRERTSVLFKTLFIVELILMVAYIYMDANELIFSNSFGSEGNLFLTMYYMSKGNWFFFIISLIVLIMSEKRSSLLIIIICLIYYFFKNNKVNTSLRKFKILFRISALVVLIILIYKETTLLDRFGKFADMSLTDFNSVDIATSGRITEITYVVNYITQKVDTFLFGMGFGGKIYNGLGRYVSFIHFSPLNYALISGVPSAIIIYYFLTKDFFLNIREKKERINWSSIGWIGYFILSFTSAAVATNLMFWFVYGAYKKSTEYNYYDTRSDS